MKVVLTSKNKHKLRATQKYFEDCTDEIITIDVGELGTPEQPCGDNVENIYNCGRARIQQAIDKGLVPDDTDYIVSFENGIIDKVHKFDNMVETIDVCTVTIFKLTGTDFEGKYYQYSYDATIHIEVPMTQLRKIEDIGKEKSYKVGDYAITGYDKTCGSIMAEKFGLDKSNWMEFTHGISRYEQLEFTIGMIQLD